MRETGPIVGRPLDKCSEMFGAFRCTPPGFVTQVDGPPRKSRKEDPHAAAVRQVEKAMARARVAQQKRQKSVPTEPRLQCQAVQQ